MHHKVVLYWRREVGKTKKQKIAEIQRRNLKIMPWVFISMIFRIGLVSARQNAFQKHKLFVSQLSCPPPHRHYTSRLSYSNTASLQRLGKVAWIDTGRSLQKKYSDYIMTLPDPHDAAAVVDKSNKKQDTDRSPTSLLRYDSGNTEPQISSFRHAYAQIPHP